MNFDDEIYVTEVESYTEFRYDSMRIGIFGEHENQHVGNLPPNTIIFLKYLTEYNTEEYDLYYSFSIPVINDTVRIKTHGPKLLMPTINDTYQTVNDLKQFISNDIGPLINIQEPVTGEYTRVRMISLLQQAIMSDNTDDLFGLIVKMYNVLSVSSILSEIFKTNPKNCIIYVLSDQVPEFEYFFKNVLSLPPVVSIQKKPFIFNRSQKRLSFLFEKSPDLLYIKQFQDTFENCDPTRTMVSKADTFLLSMCNVIPLVDVKYIYGPITYTEFTDGIRTIGIFGENHRIPVPASGIINKRNTVSVPSLLKIILDTFPTKFYDLFLEMEYTKTDVVVKNSITSFNIFFKNCLKIVKECPFDNIRAHYTDYRSILSGNTIYDEFMKHFAIIYFHDSKTDMSRPYFTLENLSGVFDRSRDIVKNTIDTNPKLQMHQGTNLYFFVLLEIVKLKTLFDKEKQMYKTPLSVVEAQKLVFYIMRLYVLLMDLYTIGRVFKTFKTTDSAHPSTAVNSIIYAGDAHADNYRLFLTSIGFKRVHHVETTIGNVLDFTSVRNTSFLFNTN